MKSTSNDIYKSFTNFIDKNALYKIFKKYNYIYQLSSDSLSEISSLTLLFSYYSFNSVYNKFNSFINNFSSSISFNKFSLADFFIFSFF